jgi:hypothetical protein
MQEKEVSQSNTLARRAVSNHKYQFLNNYYYAI